VEKLLSNIEPVFLKKLLFNQFIENGYKYTFIQKAFKIGTFMNIYKFSVCTYNYQMCGRKITNLNLLNDLHIPSFKKTNPLINLTTNLYSHHKNILIC